MPPKRPIVKSRPSSAPYASLRPLTLGRLSASLLAIEVSSRIRRDFVWTGADWR